MENIYAVLNKLSLGYFCNEEKTIFKTLSSKIGGLNWMDGPVFVSTLDEIRPATPADFDEFRVMI